MTSSLPVRTPRTSLLDSVGDRPTPVGSQVAHDYLALSGWVVSLFYDTVQVKKPHMIFVSDLETSAFEQRDVHRIQHRVIYPYIAGL